MSESETEREKESFTCWFSFQAVLGWQSQMPRIPSALPRGWKGPNCLSYHLLSPGCPERKPDWKQSSLKAWNLNLYLICVPGAPSSGLTHYVTTPDPVTTYWVLMHGDHSQAKYYVHLLTSLLLHFWCENTETQLLGNESQLLGNSSALCNSATLP